MNTQGWGIVLQARGLLASIITQRGSLVESRKHTRCLFSVCQGKGSADVGEKEG